MTHWPSHFSQQNQNANVYFEEKAFENELKKPWVALLMPLCVNPL